jgi:hypothetical protein
MGFRVRGCGGGPSQFEAASGDSLEDVSMLRVGGDNDMMYKVRIQHARPQIGSPPRRYIHNPAWCSLWPVSVI